MAETEQVTDVTIARFMARIDATLNEILRRLDDGQDKMRAHEAAITQQAIQCAECREKIKAAETNAATLRTDLDAVKTDLAEQSGSRKSWRTAFWVLVGLATVAGVFAAFWGRR